MIELLVVISVISLLSTVVLTSVRLARQKANDTVTASQVKQYTDVLLQIRGSDNSFPNSDSSMHCLGNNTICPAGSTHNPTLDNEVDYFLPGSPPVNNPPVYCTNEPRNGISYLCLSSPCVQLSLYWCIPGTTTCPDGMTIPYGGNTFCVRVPFP